MRCGNCGEWNVCVCGSIWTVWHLITREREYCVEINNCGKPRCSVKCQCTQTVPSNPADNAEEKEGLKRWLNITKSHFWSTSLSILLHISIWKNRIKEILGKCKPFICDPQLRCGRECRAVITTPSPIILAMTGGCWTTLTAMTNHIKHPVILNHNNNWCNGSHKHNYHYI